MIMKFTRKIAKGDRFTYLEYTRDRKEDCNENEKKLWEIAEIFSGKKITGKLRVSNNTVLIAEVV